MSVKKNIYLLYKAMYEWDLPFKIDDYKAFLSDEWLDCSEVNLITIDTLEYNNSMVDTEGWQEFFQDFDKKHPGDSHRFLHNLDHNWRA